MQPDKDGARVLRFLKGGAARMTNSGSNRLLIEGGERGTIATSADTVRQLAAEGRVITRGDKIALAPEGNAAGKNPVRETIMTPEGPATVTVNASESPLGALWRHRDKTGARFLSGQEFNAGERLRADYTRAQIMPRLGVNWDIAGGTGKSSRDINSMAGLTDTALAARLRVEKAIEAVGPEFAGVLVDICCFLKGLETVERERAWPARSAKIMLKSALSALSRHYEPPRRDSHAKILRWGADDYRPEVTANQSFPAVLRIEEKL